MKYIEATFKIDSGADMFATSSELLAAIAGECGFEAFVDTADGLKGYVQPDNFDRAALDAGLADFPIDGVKISYTTCDAPDEDWNDEWEKQGFDPIVINDECIIYDAKQAPGPSEPATCAYPILIDAKQAFGTGTHDTTRMLVGLLYGMQLNGLRVLDCGCGTGILGIAAAKFGARDIMAYDIDDWSVNNTMHNAELNGIGNISVRHGSSDVLTGIGQHFDVVVANINRNILLADMERLRNVMAPGATLLISGFYTSDIEALKDEGTRLGLTACGQAESNDWACLVFKAGPQA